MAPNITDELACFLTNLSYEDLPSTVIEKAKICILDSLGCVLGASKTDLIDIIWKSLKFLGGNETSTVFGVWEKTSCTNAAFANATLANALDFDDTYGGHPGTTIVPPAVAVAEMTGTNGKELITAIVVGYEISIRISKAMIPSYKVYQQICGLGTFQSIGAASTSAKLLGLGNDKMANALGIACANTPVPSIRKSIGSTLGVTMVKNAYGVAAMTGIMSAILAKNGFTGPRDIFEGQKGFWRMSGSDQCDYEAITHRLGDKYEILDVEFKPYTACRHFHGAIDAALGIVNEHNINPEDIVEVNVATYGHPELNIWPYNRKDPQNMYDMEFSVPYSVALALLGIKPSLKWLGENLSRKTEIYKLAKKVKIVTKVMPQQTYPHKGYVVVEVNTSKGRYVSKVKHPKGSPQNPLSDHELIDKFRKLSHGVVKNDNIEYIVKTTLNLQEATNIRKMINMFYHG